MKHDFRYKLQAIWKILYGAPVVYGVEFECYPNEVPFKNTFVYSSKFDPKEIDV